MKALKPASMPSLAILICTHNRAELLARVLVSLNQAARPSDWSVRLLVAANACTDGTHDLLEAYRRSRAETGAIELEWFAEPTPGKSHALNSAIPRLTGDIVAFVDDDQRVDAGYLVNICRAAQAYPDATMFCGRMLPDWDGSEPVWVHDEGRYRIYPLPVPRYDQGANPTPIDVETGPLPGGGNLFLRIDVFARTGGFSTELGPKGHDLGGGEDSAFVLHALTSGECLQYVPDVLQYHYVDVERLRFSYLLRKAYQRSRSSSRVHHEGGGVPLYMWRKLAEYGAKAALPLNWPRTRFYLMRVASTLGEVRGLHEAARKARAREAGHSAARPSRRPGWPLAFAGLVLTGLGALFQAAPAAILVPNLAVTLLLSALLTGGLVAKSLLNFSQTGPQVRDEILAHYRYYSLYALMRLAAFAYLILLLQAGSGVLLAGAVADLSHQALSAWASILAGLIAVVMLTGLQFCRHLLLLPASLVASSHYRTSRLYPLWRQLSPLRLRLLGAVLLLPTVGLAVALAFSLAINMNLAGLLSLFAFVSGAITLYFWLRPRGYPAPITQTTRSARPNILMIGSDTLRADRIGPRLSPHIDQLSRQGAYFTQCYVPCARTAPSLISLLTGTWPHKHGIRDNFVADADTQLNVPALPELLRRQGYTTAALSDWCGSDLGKFQLGFDYLDLPEDQWNLKLFIRQGPKDLRLFLSLFTHNTFGKAYLPEIHYLGGVPLTDELGVECGNLLNRLAASEKPFFLNTFFSTTHPPFGAEYPYYTQFSTPEYAGESKFAMARLTDPWEILRRQAEPRAAFDLDQIIHLYDGCVRRFDDEVARVLNHLDACGLSDNTIVVIYSDHGMEFFEHDTWGQGNSAVGDHSARVPLIVLDPRVGEGRRVDDVVRSIDLAPTLLNLLGLPPVPEMDGVSLATYLRDVQAHLELEAYNETGIWLADMPGMRPDHLRYPNLLELLEVADKNTGTLAIKSKYRETIILSKDRMVRAGKWKLVYQPMEGAALWQLFDIEGDRNCLSNVIDSNPKVANRLRNILENWMDEDQSCYLG
jgi:arylsulfatase A-like enzyme/GT2 family glycosyltransferase